MVRFYAVKIGRVPGVYQTWAECGAQVTGYSGAMHQSFASLRDAFTFSGVTFGQLAPWAQAALTENEQQEGPPPPYPSDTAPPRTSSFNAAYPSTIHSISPNTSVTLSPNHARSTPDTPLMRADRIAASSADDFGLSELNLDDIRLTNYSFSERLQGLTGNGGPLSERLPVILPPTVESEGRRNSECDQIGSSPTRLPAVDARYSTPARRQSPLVASAQACAPIPLSSSPHNNNAPQSSALHDAAYLATSVQDTSINIARPIAARANDSQWSSTNHSDWIEDSILSNIFHPPAAGPPRSPSIISQADPSGARSTRWNRRRPTEVDIDPMEPSTAGFQGVPDSNTWNHRIHLRGASNTITRYSPALRYLLGEHAVNYLYMHYYSAGSSTLIADAYVSYSNDAESFIRVLGDSGMPPRHAAYFWAIISPEVYLGPPGTVRRYSPGDFSLDDQDMSFVQSAAGSEG